jgi:hypothetical protein
MRPPVCKPRQPWTKAGLQAICATIAACDDDSPDPQVWVVMGSSTAAGQGATAGQAWSDRLAQAFAAHGVVLVNIAQAGTVTFHGLPTGTSEQCSSDTKYRDSGRCGRDRAFEPAS